ncbi:pleckstrin homology domain-containing family G member 3-like isoform X4 [Salarias fasciatus]|uniref:pleckstrin homology domain-containing family G member 3-like isoform X4 n=1 Tax=Salarias fasciatus TaxID=181472 RepID=UPI0011764C64|nr:pleckstrin homology domain-containing family G member 3-like isoform X4 [Salarias fasciatus]
MPEGSHSALDQGPMGEESPQLSSPLSAGDHVQGSLDLDPDCDSHVCVEPPDGEGERPVSLVSTLSSGSSRDSRSLFGSTAALPSSATPPMQSEEDIDLELVPADGPIPLPAAGQSSTLTGSRGRWLHRLEPKVKQWNNNATTNRKASAQIPHVPGAPVVTDAMAPNPKLTYVDRVVMEIIETERMYVKDLRSIVEDYLAHIIDMSNLPIRPEQVCALFGNIEDIYEFNSELLQSLDMCRNDPVAIAQCFVNKSEYFEIYTQYCTNYPNSVAALTDCMRSKTLAKFFRDRQAALKRSLPLGSYLLKPVQRILKYHLLLQEIAKHFDPDEEGYEVVQDAIDTMTGVAWYINDMKRKHEHAVRVQEIQSLLINWKGPDLTTYGELVLEGTFHVLRAKNTRTLFLFERMLLITKKRGEHYVYKIHISCSTLMLLDSAKDPLLFSVIHFKHPKQPHTVQARSVEEKRLWAHHIKRLILENHNTILPQRAKEAILDNSNYSGKYQYSPERLKKTESCHADDFQQKGRNGRRRSEPEKQITRNTKAVLKDDHIKDGAEVEISPREEVETCRQEEKPEDGAVKESLGIQAAVQELHPPDGVPQEKDISHQEENDSQCPDSPVTRSEQETETPEPQDTSQETGEEEGGSDSSGLPVEEASVLTNSELSEEEEEVLSGSKSILPSSVLDQASAIAEHFISSLSRRSSLVSEDLGSLACPSPSVDNDASQSPSAGMDLEKHSEMLLCSSPEPHATSKADLSAPPLLEPGVEMLAEGECRSTLSKQDRLLIRKIRKYYEHAEHQDADFSIKRRESLSYIPAGLVRHLSRQLNSVPQEKAVPAPRKGLSRNRPTSWSVFDLPGLEKSRNTETQHRIEAQTSVETKARSHSVTEEEFRPSSDMLEVWRVMEAEEDSRETQQILEEKVTDSHFEVMSDISSDSSHAKLTEQQFETIKECDPTDRSSMSSPVPVSPAVEGGSAPDSKPSKNHTSSENHSANHSHLPKIISFRTGMDEDQILQDMGKMKNKVFQLARQYSQRIKNNRPMVWSRNRESANQQGVKSLSAVQEEKTQWRKRGKPSLRLPLNSCDQSVIHEVHSPDPIPPPSSGSSSQDTLTSPQSPQPEAFHWPDVQELRSKYASGPHSKISRSNTVPNGMLECSRDGSNGCSVRCSSCLDLHKGLTDCPGSESGRSAAVGDVPQTQAQLHPLLCRWSSLDHVVTSLPLHEVQNLQEPVRTGSPVRLQDRDLRRDGVEGAPKAAALSSGKTSESNLVKSLRQKFQSLGSSL